MLKYSIKLTNDNIIMDEVVWGERYLSPDHSFATGVTSQEYHLEKQRQITGSLNGKTDILNIKTENVTRRGYVIIKGKKYKVNSAKIYNYSEDEPETVKYIEVNGSYYYVINGKVTIPNWLIERYSVKIVDGEKTFVPGTIEGIGEGEEDGEYVKLDTIYWIEDNKVNIDGHTYLFDPDEMSGGLKYYEDGPCLSAEEITECDSISFAQIKNPSDFNKVTKFKLEEDEEVLIGKDKISFITHLLYITYNNKYYPIEVTSGGNYVCTIGETSYDVIDETGVIITTDIASEIEDLYSMNCSVSAGTDLIIPVESMIQDSNYGNKIGIYLSNETTNLTAGDTISLRKFSEGIDYVEVETDISGETFILYDGVKYQLIPNLMDAVKINNVEYDIIRYENNNGYVNINDEEVPMKKDNDNHLIPYGYILKGNSFEEFDEEKYDIIQYSGVTINGQNYKVKTIIYTYTDTAGTITSSDPLYYIDSQDYETVYKLMIEEVIGSSLIVCKPLFNVNEFSSDYIKTKTDEICADLVENQTYFYIFEKNKLFGERETLPQNGMLINSNATSTNDYEDIINNIILYANNGHIEVPLFFNVNIANNVLHDDLVERDFVETETQKAINPIIDMDRDVYTPKYIENSMESCVAYQMAGGTFNPGMTNEEKKHAYIGAFTDFKPIYEININPHFRTRNESNWKVNNTYDDNTVSGLCNWFITDYEPYKSLLDSKDLSTVSDLLGLLWFTNMDVFYQKSALEKTFIRLSYYDSTDSQNQSMLHNSTVFYDEHNSFKKFIDNSRKNINLFMAAETPTGTTPTLLNKINVLSEYVGPYKSDGSSYDKADPLNENKRLSSRFTIKSKYETDTSSEGFYLYIFKDYAENLHPKPIYMKVEFNHAGLGKTIPFNIPMKWGGNSEIYDYPISALTLSNSDDIETLKSGITLSYVVGQSYIPLYAMYDFKNKEYVYIFDERYVTVNDGIVNLNIFELKIKEETYSGTTKTALIDINDKQIVVR